MLGAGLGGFSPGLEQPGGAARCGPERLCLAAALQQGKFLSLPVLSAAPLQILAQHSDRVPIPAVPADTCMVWGLCRPAALLACLPSPLMFSFRSQRQGYGSNAALWFACARAVRRCAGFGSPERAPCRARSSPLRLLLAQLTLRGSRLLILDQVGDEGHRRAA